MADRKQFKTKICFLYQRGRCSRQNCNFAHGNVELRRSGSYNVRQEYQGGDLRHKLDRRHSPGHRFPSRDDTKRKSISHGLRPTDSPDQRKRRRKNHFDGHSNFSGSLRNSEGIKGHTRDDGRTKKYESKTVEEEQLKRVNSDIKMLEERRLQLVVHLDEKVQKADSLTSRINELSSQLEREKEQCKRITGKIKKFVKAHNRCSRLEGDLERSRARLHKLGDQLVAESARNEEDSNINIVSEGEAIRNAISPMKEHNNDASPRNQDRYVSARKYVHQNQNANSPVEAYPGKETALENLPCGDEEVRVTNNDSGSPRVSIKGGNQNNEKSQTISNHFTDKLKSQEARIPRNSMAANAIDEVEIVAEDTMDVVESPIGSGKIAASPFLVPPPLPDARANYVQYEGEDEDVNVDGHVEDTVTVDTV